MFLVEIIHHIIHIIFINEVNYNFQWIVPMADGCVDLYTFHIESTHDAKEICRRIKENGMKVIGTNKSTLDGHG